MGKLSEQESNTLVKGLYLGDAGAGKTGSLTSLVKAGYKVRIIDFDNLLRPLITYINKECPELIDNVSVQTFTDKLKGTDTPLVMVGAAMKVMPPVDGTPKAFVNAMKQMTYWKDPKTGEDLGDPAEWGPEAVLVIDTLTTAAQAAFRYVCAMNPAGREPQAYYFAAQQMIVNMIQLLCAEQVKTNVLILAHINYDKNHLDITKGFPRSIGSALNDQIANYFNCVLMAESQGTGANAKRVIRTNSTGVVDLKNPVSFKVPDSLPLESGLADFFEAVKVA